MTGIEGNSSFESGYSRGWDAFATGPNGSWGNLEFGNGLPPPGLYQRILREVEVPLISAALGATRGNQIKAAELLGLNRNTLRKKIRELDIHVMRRSV